MPGAALDDIAASVAPLEASPASVRREVEARLAAGAVLRPAGSARRRPRRLLDQGYVPRHAVRLFDTTFYLAAPRQNEDIRFFVAYLARDRGGRAARTIHPRILYKDVSLVWRSASHFVRSDDENWIGKGDVKPVEVDGGEGIESDEATTDLPLEIQSALEEILREARRIPYDDDAVPRVLRRGGDDRIAAYADFTGPRRRAARDPRNLVHRGRPVARFTRANDPTSLTFVRGFEPDFAAGIVEHATSKSRLYGGRLDRYRVVSTNRRIQFLFFAGPRQVWIGSCQATTRELSSYGVRVVDVNVPDDLLLPGYEYHFLDDTVDPPEWVSQIPDGFAGPPSPQDSSRCDASPWLDRMPVVREFRRRVLARRGGRPRPAGC